MGPSPATARARAVARGFDHREHVVAVDPDARDTRPRSALAANVGAAVWRAGGRGDRPPVVEHHHEQRHALHAGEVQALVEVAFRRGAVADERARDAGLALQLQAPGDARGVRYLRAEGDLRREAEHAVGDAPAVGMAPPVHDDLLEELVAERGHADSSR